MEADAEILDVVCETNVPIVLMHMRGTPKNMQTQCEYKNVVEEVAVHLAIICGVSFSFLILAMIQGLLMMTGLIPL